MNTNFNDKNTIFENNILFNMKKKLLFIAFIFITLNASAKYVQTCTVRYMTQDGWSKKYVIEVTFLTGSELNEATNSYKYSSYSTYGVIFWGNKKASVIKLISYTLCGSEVDKDCITNTYSDLKGKDQDDDEWKICVSDYCY
ncbi:hypothetical protein [Flavobacterium lipolyticum]|uniref:Uncharacterized protein n=1 Tax=Flavobacterium lipolyticum TaxID=2893754 RepID=A0ABS8M2F5_9FLAO|nr:hypothetical protein [Flavobacterium sp. F-126]MCC9019002.1 hypothetical protein [Flavobacterium sp. F-126]